MGAWQGQQAEHTQQDKKQRIACAQRPFQRPRALEGRKMPCGPKEYSGKRCGKCQHEKNILHGKRRTHKQAGHQA